MGQEKRGFFKWTDTDEQGHQRREAEFLISEHGNNHQVNDWNEDKGLGDNPKVEELIERMRAIHVDHYAGSQPQQSGLAAFSFGSPGCVYYWINGRLFYR